MNTTIIIAIAVLGLLLLAAIFLFLKSQKKQQTGQEAKINYLALFSLGITFVSAGIVLSLSLNNPGFYGMTAPGFIYVAIALAHRDQWQKNNH